VGRLFRLCRRDHSGADFDSPTDTGGGSEGYNWNLSHDY